jgi:hypothetical protein
MRILDILNLVVLAGVAVALPACSGRAFSSESTGGAVSGAECTTDGARATAADGCNTCECTSGTWVCTDRACGPGEPTCQDGEQQGEGCGACTCSDGQWMCPDVECPNLCAEGEVVVSADGCNTCTCADGAFACTRMACVEPTCTDGESYTESCKVCECSGGQWTCLGTPCAQPICPEPDVRDPWLACPAVVVYARDPETGTCCEYGDPCRAPEGWEQFNTFDACSQGASCLLGETRPDADGCNTCSCDAQGQWVCTLMYCGCVTGETRRAEDGCNVCLCDASGVWVCTAEAGCTSTVIACGGWAGNTCTDDEYCAYQPGDYCGAADASATCESRPDGCNTGYDPVCGCDGNTYGNACEAAAHGTGVLALGPCTL